MVGGGVESAVEYEAKWLKRWLESCIFEAEPDPSRPKVFITFPYSYQNGPLHVGHGFTATRADAYARYKRMKGYNVLFPWAWHWTGEAVAGTSERLKRGDEAIVRMLRDIDGVPEDKITRFTEPEYICEYYTQENREIAKAMGYSVDWRREFYTTDLHPYYSKFIAWQYQVLLELGKVKRGSHPVVWCPACQSPTGDHDRLVGEGVSPEEFTLVYFRYGDTYIAAATLRPETIFGATNMWVNPDAEYVIAYARGVKVLVSRDAAEKLREQFESLSVIESVAGKDLVGKECIVPLIEKKILILPASFVDPKIGTGLVYSVPSHAPYDYAGLVELANNDDILRKLGVSKEELSKIEPISIITTPGLPEHPAVELVRRAGITSQKDPRLDELTKQIYAKEFYDGVMRENCGDLAGMPVSRAREVIRERLFNGGLGSVMYDLPERVVCRSGDECIVKIVRDQWFLNYSDEEWKEKVRGLIREMDIFPESAKQWFLNVIDWLRDWPCARKTGLGTKLSFDPEWKVETLSDSTVYQALYTISKYVNSGRVKPEQLTYSFFNYIYRGVGSPEDVCRETGIDEVLLDEIKREFEYWYPVDLRVSAKELVPNHLTFFLFQHVALFGRDKWPRGISVNGMVQVEGEKMSKSKGNFIPLKRAIATYGADATRLTLLMSAEDMDDPDWRAKNAEEMRLTLDNFLRIVEDYVRSGSNKDESPVDEWLEARLDSNIESIERYIEAMRTRSAANVALYVMMNDWRWYVRRRGGRYGPAARRFIESWIKVLTPFAPYTAEEAWSRYGGEGLVSSSTWPSVREGVDAEYSLLREELIARLLDDVRSIMGATERKPKVLHIYQAGRWTMALIEAILEIGVFEAPKSIGTLVKRFGKIAGEMGFKPRTLTKSLERLIETLKDFKPRYRDETIKRAAEYEFETYEEASSFLARELGCQIKLWRAGDEAYDPLGKAKQALPLRPGIYLELD